MINSNLLSFELNNLIIVFVGGHFQDCFIIKSIFFESLFNSLEERNNLNSSSQDLVILLMVFVLLINLFVKTRSSLP